MSRTAKTWDPRKRRCVCDTRAPGHRQPACRCRALRAALDTDVFLVAPGLAGLRELVSRPLANEAEWRDAALETLYIRRAHAVGLTPRHPARGRKRGIPRAGSASTGVQYDRRRPQPRRSDGLTLDCAAPLDDVFCCESAPGFKSFYERESLTLRKRRFRALLS